MNRKYPLQSLLLIRNQRLEKSLKDKIACQQKVTQAESEIVTLREKLEEYILWRESEEQHRYECFFIGKYKLQEIQEFNSGIKSLRMKETEMQEEINKAQIRLEELRKELKAAMVTLSESRKKLQKLEMHKEIWVGLEKLEEERTNESETEDFKTKNVTEC